MILDAVRASKGLAIEVDEARIREWLELTCRLEGIAVCPETAACIGALEALTARRWIRPNERVVIFNTGAAQKYVEAIRSELPRLDVNSSIDWERLASGAGAEAEALCQVFAAELELASEIESSEIESSEIESSEIEPKGEESKEEIVVSDQPESTAGEVIEVELKNESETSLIASDSPLL